MSGYEIAAIVIGSGVLVFAILTWAGIVPKRVRESAPVKRLLKLDVVGLVIICVVGTVIYLSVTGKEIPTGLLALVGGVIVLLSARMASRS